jgi:hypothetical protein
VNRVGDRFKMLRTDGVFVIDQQTYVETDGDKISSIWIMCSGLRPSSSPPRGRRVAAAQTPEPIGGSPRNFVNTTDPWVENTIR